MSEILCGEEQVFREIFNTSPSALLVVDDDIRVICFNKSAQLLLGGAPEKRLLRRRGGEILHCLHASASPEGCGRVPACQDCMVRDSVRKAMEGERTYRRLASMQLLSIEGVSRTTFLVTASPFRYQCQRLILLALEDISELIALRGLLPICANCKKIRNEKDYWLELESYFKRYLNLEFSHGICPDCMAKLYPEIAGTLQANG